MDAAGGVKNGSFPWLPEDGKTIRSILSTKTGAVPVISISSCSAAALETSIILAGTNGPRSLTLTVTLLSLCLLVTTSTVPKGSVG